MDTDSAQPATLQADDFELDLANGVRIYRGAVVFQQGSIRLDCDQLITHYDAEDELAKGVCSGAPGRFRQRPEGAETDFIGRAESITFDRVANLITFAGDADIQHGGDRIQGGVITYDLAAKKAKVVAVDDGTGYAITDDDDTDDDTDDADADTDTGTERPRLIIQPRSDP